MLLKTRNFASAKKMKVHLEFFKLSHYCKYVWKNFCCIYSIYRLTAISKIIFDVLFSLPFSVYCVSNIDVLNVGR